MKDAAKVNDRVEDVFNGLLFGLPPGILSGFVWLAYSVWMFLTHRLTPLLSQEGWLRP
jgi:hypothetical protein